MEQYRIIATIESIDFESNCKLTLKGVSKYCFEKGNGNGKEKEYFNVFEKVEGTPPDLKSKNQNEPILLNGSITQVQLLLLGYAFCEKKKLKFELDGELSIIRISHASE